MDETSSNNQPAQAAPQVAQPTTPTAEASQSATPVQATTTAQTATPAPVPCKCPAINAAEWDKKRQKLNKTFHKTFSPRLFYYPFSFVIDVDRATRGAVKKGYKPVDGGMVLDTGGMFWGSVLIEVTDAKLEDGSVVDFTNKEIYTKVVTRPWNELKAAIDELNKELGAAPLELYTWWTSCPKCVASKEVKVVLIAVTAQTMAAKAPEAAAPQSTASTQPETQPPAPQQEPASQQPAAAPEQPASQQPPQNPPAEPTATP